MAKRSHTGKVRRLDMVLADMALADMVVGVVDLGHYLAESLAEARMEVRTV